MSVPQVWQVSGCTGGSSYADALIRSGVALVGPGDGGPWRAGGTRYGDAFGSPVRRLAEEAEEGDIVLLRTDQATICAVGIVAGSYEYLPQFDDVHGLDLQHARRVRWLELPDVYTFGHPVFGGSTPAFSQVSGPDVVDFARRVVRSEPSGWQYRRLPDLPPEESELGEPPEFIRGLVAQVHDLVGLYVDEGAFGEPPSESEMVAHYVVPLLRALGWRPEQIALEWRRTDVALFVSLPRAPETCRCIIEAKRLGTGVEAALQQGKDYAAAIGGQLDVVVTDGIRYRLYAAERGYAPVAYANLARLKQPALVLFDALRRP